MRGPGFIVGNRKTLAIVCNQWGDTGKGKVVDLYADWADIIARGTGGNNAGHTIVLDGVEHVFHLIPSGILKDKEGKINIMGSGMVIDLRVLVGEMNKLKEHGYSYEGLMISERANLILGYHKQRDGLQSGMGKGKIGTTGRGIGPAYADKIARFGIKVGDLSDRDVFFKKLKRVKEHHFYLDIDIEEIVEEQYKDYERIKELVYNTDSFLRKAVEERQRVLLEGAQGLLLSIDYGTEPYVTSSDCSRYGLAKGVGLLPEQIELTLGIVKFPFMTRVGNGPFPTEYGGRRSEEYCAEEDGEAHKELIEEREYSFIKDLINSPDEFKKGIGIRLAAKEYGATTGRPRRVGRTDLVALEYAMRINGRDIILTKADCVKGMEKVELGVGYKDNLGKEVRKINHGLEIAYGLRGEHKKFDGWKEELRECETYNDLPRNLLKIINEELQSRLKARVRMVSVGPERGQVLVSPIEY